MVVNQQSLTHTIYLSIVLIWSTCHDHCIIAFIDNPFLTQGFKLSVLAFWCSASCLWHQMLQSNMVCRFLLLMNIEKLDWLMWMLFTWPSEGLIVPSSYIIWISWKLSIDLFSHMQLHLLQFDSCCWFRTFNTHAHTHVKSMPACWSASTALVDEAKMFSNKLSIEEWTRWTKWPSLRMVTILIDFGAKIVQQEMLFSFCCF